MISRLHAIAGGIALLTIIVFWSATVISEIWGEPAHIRLVKTGILYGLAVLIPAIALTGASGFALGKSSRSPVIRRKTGRMKIIAFNGIGILAPCAVFLAYKAQSLDFDRGFMIAQALELGAGALNIALMSLNVKDGLAMTAKRRRARRTP